jgi:hypothetical protein
MGPNTDAAALRGAKHTYDNLIDLWTSGVRDYHSLLSDYLMANSVFVAAIGFLLSRQSVELLLSFLVIVLCVFGILMALQMAIVLGRFSAQNAVWEWQLRGIENDPTWTHRKLFVDLYRFRDSHQTLENRENDPPSLSPDWAVRRHRQWWARREISFPLFFGITYGLLLLWDVLQLAS